VSPAFADAPIPLAHRVDTNPVFLDELIQVAHACIQQYYGRINDVDERVKMTNTLQQYLVDGDLPHSLPVLDRSKPSSSMPPSPSARPRTRLPRSRTSSAPRRPRSSRSTRSTPRSSVWTQAVKPSTTSSCTTCRRSPRPPVPFTTPPSSALSPASSTILLSRRGTSRACTQP